MKYTRSIGTRDILPEEAVLWEYATQVLREASALFSYGEIRTPAFENAEVFIHSVGDTSDIVTKEMYLFNDKSDRQLVLKPEGTASIVRAYVENHYHVCPKPVKLYYIDTFHRYERPQKGRFREFHQFGVELFGSNEPSSDAEVIHLCFFILNKLGFQNLTLDLNSIGCKACRPLFREKLVAFLTTKADDLCEDCRKRIDKNPLRVLDCKNPICQKAVIGAPAIDEHLCDKCNEHYLALQLLLDHLEIPYRKNPMLVRGLDYYQRTVFEVLSSDLGSQSALLGGGRYDELVETMGGPPTPAIGFAMGLERLIMLMQQLPSNPQIRSLSPQCFIAHEGKDTLTSAMCLAAELRQDGISTDIDLEGKGIKKGLELAIKKNVKAVLIIGKNEIEQKIITLKNLNDRSQTQYPKEQILIALKELLEDKQ
jgi:histidyl-tRNA synthetase